MAVLRSTWNSADDLNDAEKAMLEAGYIVEGSDGKLHLDGVEGFDPKSKTKEFRDENIDLRKEIEDLKDKYKGALTAAEKAEYDERMQALTDRLEAGDDDKRVKELVEKRMTDLQIGDRTIRVERGSKAALEAYLRKTNETLQGLESTSATLSTELTKERLEGKARAEYLKLPGHRPNAADDVVRFYRERAVMGDDYQPYIPDPDAEPVNGELPPPLMGEDGKPVGIAADMKRIAESGEKAGVWFDDPGGPPSGKRRPGHAGKPSELHGQARIAAELRKRQGAAA